MSSSNFRMGEQTGFAGMSASARQRQKKLIAQQRQKMQDESAAQRPTQVLPEKPVRDRNLSPYCNGFKRTKTKISWGTSAGGNVSNARIPTDVACQSRGYDSGLVNRLRVRGNKVVLINVSTNKTVMEVLQYAERTEGVQIEWLFDLTDDTAKYWRAASEFLGLNPSREKSYSELCVERRLLMQISTLADREVERAKARRAKKRSRPPQNVRKARKHGKGNENVSNPQAKTFKLY